MARDRIPELRRKNLWRLHEKLSWEEIAARTGTSSQYLSQIANAVVQKGGVNPRALSDDYATRIETGLELSDGWMDQDHESPPPDSNIGIRDAASEYAARTPAFTARDLATLCTQIPASKIDLTHAILSAIIDDAAQATDPISGVRPPPTDPDKAPESLLRNDIGE